MGHGGRRLGGSWTRGFAGWVALAVTLSVAVLAAACSGSRAPEDTAMPSWLVRVYPQPGAQSSSVRAVEVEYHPSAGDNVRLLIDGVDVTSSARLGASRGMTGPGLLHYDPNAPGSPVALRPGEHSARVEKTPGDSGGAPQRNLGAFSWQFSVQ